MPFLAVTLNPQIGKNMQQSIITLGHFIDGHRDRMGQFIRDTLQGGLSDELCYPGFLALFGGGLAVIQRLRLGQQGEDFLYQHIQLGTLQSRDGNDARPVPQLINFHEPLSDHCVGGRISLVTSAILSALGYSMMLWAIKTISRPYFFGGRNTHRDDVYFTKRVGDNIIETLAQKSPRAVNAGGIDNNDLAVLAMNDAPEWPCGWFGVLKT